MNVNIFGILEKRYSISIQKFHYILKAFILNLLISFADSLTRQKQTGHVEYEVNDPVISYCACWDTRDCSKR